MTHMVAGQYVMQICRVSYHCVVVGRARPRSRAGIGLGTAIAGSTSSRDGRQGQFGMVTPLACGDASVVPLPLFDN